MLYRVFWLYDEGEEQEWVFEAAFAQEEDARSWLMWNNGQLPLEVRQAHRIKHGNKIVYEGENW